MKKVALILSSNIERAPYLNYYIDILNEIHVDFDVIYWNKDNILNKYAYNTISFNKPFSIYSSKISKIVNIYRYTSFVKRKVSQNGYSYIILFTIPPSLFLVNFLRKKFWNRYIIDIRDYSPLISFCSIFLHKVIYGSYVTCISSFGFYKWLPQYENKIILSHNIRKSLLSKQDSPVTRNTNIRILTIGQLRDWNINSMFLSCMANMEGFSLHYAGFGEVYDELHKKSIDNGYENICFEGKYEKENEYKIVRQCDFINAITADDNLNRDIITNRFYLSLIYYKPLLVYKNTYQAELVQQYGLGIVVDDISQLPLLIKEYYTHLDYNSFIERCNIVITKILRDIEVFEKTIRQMIQ